MKERKKEVTDSIKQIRNVGGSYLIHDDSYNKFSQNTRVIREIKNKEQVRFIDNVQQTQ